VAHHLAPHAKHGRGGEAARWGDGRIGAAGRLIDKSRSVFWTDSFLFLLADLICFCWLGTVWVAGECWREWQPLVLSSAAGDFRADGLLSARVVVALSRLIASSIPTRRVMGPARCQWTADSGRAGTRSRTSVSDAPSFILRPNRWLLAINTSSGRCSRVVQRNNLKRQVT